MLSLFLSEKQRFQRHMINYSGNSNFFVASPKQPQVLVLQKGNNFPPFDKFSYQRASEIVSSTINFSIVPSMIYDSALTKRLFVLQKRCCERRQEENLFMNEALQISESKSHQIWCWTLCGFLEVSTFGYVWLAFGLLTRTWHVTVPPRMNQFCFIILIMSLALLVKF